MKQNQHSQKLKNSIKTMTLKKNQKWYFLLRFRDTFSGSEKQFITSTRKLSSKKFGNEIMILLLMSLCNVTLR